jgi:hypothetical protein
MFALPKDQIQNVYIVLRQRAKGCVHDALSSRLPFQVLAPLGVAGGRIHRNGSGSLTSGNSTRLIEKKEPHHKLYLNSVPKDVIK